MKLHFMMRQKGHIEGSLPPLTHIQTTRKRLMNRNECDNHYKRVLQLENF